jgi:hypothetical protein
MKLPSHAPRNDAELYDLVNLLVLEMVEGSPGEELIEIGRPSAVTPAREFTAAAFSTPDRAVGREALCAAAGPTQREALLNLGARLAGMAAVRIAEKRHSASLSLLSAERIGAAACLLMLAIGEKPAEKEVR